jgi:hypothetical protein
MKKILSSSKKLHQHFSLMIFKFKCNKKTLQIAPREIINVQKLLMALLTTRVTTRQWNTYLTSNIGNKLMTTIHYPRYIVIHRSSC